MTRTVVIGGGIMGLSIAWELSGRGHRVSLVDREQVGRPASWAGAGILVPANEQTAIHPLDQLTALSNRLHAEWAVDLKSETGIDNGFQVCGGIYLARSLGEAAALSGLRGYWEECQIEYLELSATALGLQQPHLSTAGVRMALSVPGEAQIRNPHHLRALRAGCRSRGVEFHQSVGDPCFETRSGQLVALRLGNQRIEGDRFCITAGAWTSELLHPLGVNLSMIPVRGQMLLYFWPESGLKTILNEGSRYVVPRPDGHILVGSSTEEAGFEPTTTKPVLAELEAFAASLLPALTPERLESQWAGLRPATYDGFPYLGRLPNWENGFVATGHFKVGLQQSTGTALVMADLVEEKPPRIDLAPFDPARVKEEIS
ncbi:MAG: FAD-dependent oxidoreductase [Mariniblastus sp.]|nr:FAD-dependent oxidoreductase [Mariniblastus sp.]